jgi:hypothetical protein
MTYVYKIAALVALYITLLWGVNSQVDPEDCQRSLMQSVMITISKMLLATC